MKDLIVAVRRESSTGRLFSMVTPYPIPAFVGEKILVIDRQKGQRMSSDTVIFRAKRLAIILGVPFLLDPRWVCGAARLATCVCPACQGAPGPHESIPEPTPVRLDPHSMEPIR